MHLKRLVMSLTIAISVIRAVWLVYADVDTADVGDETVSSEDEISFLMNL